MAYEVLKHKNWLSRNLKWMLPLVIVILLGFNLFFSLTATHLGDFGKAYTEPKLYQGALKIAQNNVEVTQLLGQLEPVGKMAILEGEIEYTENNSHVDLSVRVIGTKGKAKMHVVANRKNDSWEYKKILIRVRNPSGKRQTITIK